MSKQWIPLSNEERATTGFTHKLILEYTDVTGESSGQAFEAYPVLSTAVNGPKGLVVTRAGCNVITAFAGSGITSLTLSLGDGGSATRYINAANLLAADTYTFSSPSYVYTAADTIDFTITAVGGALSALNAGKVEIYLGLFDINDLEK